MSNEDVRWAMAALGVCLGSLGLFVAAFGSGRPRWHHPSERRPPAGTECWIYLKGGDILIAFADPGSSCGWNNFDAWGDLRGDVCAWMPAQVPDPPGEGWWSRWRS